MAILGPRIGELNMNVVELPIMKESRHGFPGIVLNEVYIFYAAPFDSLDDLVDAFQTPANPDWQQGRNNLPLLYARTASHPARARFIDLLPRASEAQALRQAQQILIDSGAVSYCVYQLIRRQQEAKTLLDSLSPPNPDPLADLLARQTSPVVSLMETVGVEAPAELWKEF